MPCWHRGCLAACAFVACNIRRAFALQDCVARLGQQVKSNGGEGAAKVAEGTFQGDVDDDSQVSDRVRALQARLATLDRFVRAIDNNVLVLSFYFVCCHSVCQTCPTLR